MNETSAIPVPLTCRRSRRWRTPAQGEAVRVNWDEHAIIPPVQFVSIITAQHCLLLLLEARNGCDHRVLFRLGYFCGCPGAISFPLSAVVDKGALVTRRTGTEISAAGRQGLQAHRESIAVSRAHRRAAHYRLGRPMVRPME